MNEVHYTVVWKIKPGGLDKFKEIADRATALVKQNEPGMLYYQWFLSPDGARCYTIERHRNSESMLAHLENVGDILPELVEVSDIERFEVFGDPSPAAREAVDGLGAVVAGYLTGFAR